MNDDCKTHKIYQISEGLFHTEKEVRVFVWDILPDDSSLSSYTIFKSYVFYHSTMSVSLTVAVNLE